MCLVYPSLHTLPGPLTFLCCVEPCGGCSCRTREVQDVKMELEELRKSPPKSSTEEAAAADKGELFSAPSMLSIRTYICTYVRTYVRMYVRMYHEH